MQRNVFHDGFVGNDDAGSVRTHIAGHTFHTGRRIDQVFQIWLAVIQFLQRRHLFNCFRNRSRAAGNIGDHLGNLIHLIQGNVHYPADIADGVARAHGAKGDDLGHMVVTVFISTVFHNLGTLVILKVHIHIRHVDAIRVEEAFEDQAVAQRFHRSNPQ